MVAVPRVAASPVSFECKCSQIIRLQGASGAETNSWLILGEVVGVHIAHSCCAMASTTRPARTPSCVAAVRPIISRSRRIACSA
jgi:flavin reductase (DIM6/NTAB) family NADH-FMN oxidoreductase RutF